MNKIHENIRSMRLLKGWSQETMAEKLDLSPNSYANIERGETDVQLSRLEQIAQVLEIEVSDLFDFDRRVFFKFSIHNSPHATNHNNCRQLVNSSLTTATSDLEDELEKSHWMIEQKDKEIAYLKEIIELLKKPV